MALNCKCLGVELKIIVSLCSTPVGSDNYTLSPSR